jgi:hypothetical protein
MKAWHVKISERNDAAWRNLQASKYGGGINGGSIMAMSAGWRQ